MRATIIFLNFFVVLFFGVFFAYTFVAKDHIKKLAIDYAAQETISYANPLVEAAEAQFSKTTVQALLPKKQKALIQNELDAYRKDPRTYITDLAKKADAPALPESKFFSKIGSLKNRVQDRLDKNISELLTDLRIFAGSNVVAGFIALMMSFYSPKKVSTLLVWLSFLMFLGVCFTSYLYIDNFSFFDILHGNYLGWLYPSLLAYFILRLFWEGWRMHTLVGQIDEAINPTQIKTKPRP